MGLARQVDDWYHQYDSLANAIVEQAVVDYRKALEYLKKHKNDDFSDPKLESEYRQNVKMKIDCEQFFRSRWIAQLTDIDGRMIERTIRQQVRDGIHVVKMQRGGDSDY